MPAPGRTHAGVGAKNAALYQSLAIATAIIALTASFAILGSPVYRYRSGPVVRADGPTFHGALSALNESVDAAVGGPWNLFAVWGIATTLPFAPATIPWPEYNLTVNACQAQFSGLTLWNGSIPLFNGTFNSGTAPFWQFGFYSNTSSSILIATDVLDVTHVYPPMPMASACAVASGLGYEPWGWSTALRPFPADSSKMALTAWTTGGSVWTGKNQPAYETFVLGFSNWGSGYPEGLVVHFARCGLVGATGVQPGLFVLVNSDGTLYLDDETTEGCGDVSSLGPPPVLFGYTAVFSNTTLLGASNSSLAEVPFQLGPAGNPSADFNVDGLVSWMTSLNLTDSAGQRLANGAPWCPGWVTSIDECPANATGWYAVLESESGAWLDSYPSTPGGTSWEVPNVALVSNQQIVVVAPSAWNLTGDKLVLNGTAVACPVNGTATI